jgi:NAD(P)-dependent dehydrogenase (short-subunit alcohol dehydrogenase family)
MSSPLTIQQLLDLSGKVAIVTGGARGLGLAIVNRLCEAGAAVMIADQLDKQGQKAATDLKAKGYKVEFIKIDVRIPADAKTTVDATLEKFGRLDILVNDAGVWDFESSLSMPESEWDRVIDTNYKGTFFFTQAAAKAMIEQIQAGKMRNAKIVNIASAGGISAVTPFGCMTHYFTSKAAVIHMTKVLVKEFFKQNIQINAICPGNMSTAGTMESGAKADKKLTKEQTATLLKGGLPILKPDEVARVVLLYATALGDRITGTALPVDGGTLALLS